MLVHGDEDGKSDISISKDKESISAIISIFESIKYSEDNVDSTKSKVGWINFWVLYINLHFPPLPPFLVLVDTFEWF